jgi:hypothetical protein
MVIGVILLSVITDYFVDLRSIGDNKLGEAGPARPMEDPSKLGEAQGLGVVGPDRLRVMVIGTIGYVMVADVERSVAVMEGHADIYRQIPTAAVLLL